MNSNKKTKHIIEVYDNHDMKITHYPYDGTTEDYFVVRDKIFRQMQGATFYTVQATIEEI